MKSEIFKKSFPKYENNKVMLIGGWDSPINTFEDYQMAKDMGLTMMFVDQVFAKMGTEEYKKALEYCEQVGLAAILTIGNCGPHESAKNVIDNDTTDYSQFPAVKAINYWDEPFYDNFDRIEEMLNYHMAKYGDKIAFYINHFPNTAIGAFGGLNYAQFIGAFSNKILSKCTKGTRWLSADIYPLETKNGINIVRSNWLGCIETVAREGKRMNALTHFFLLSTSHHTSEDIYYREVKEEDLRYQFWVNMAFGIQAFTYFTYSGRGSNPFVCVKGDVSCSPNEQYYRAQKVNKEIQAIAPVYLNFTWNGTMPVYGINNKEKKNANFDGLNHSLAKIDVLSNTTVSEDTLIAQFKDDKGNNGLVVTNFSDPHYKKTDKIVLRFKKASYVRVFNKGQHKDRLLENNTFELTLEPGDGAFLIVLTE